MNLFVILLLLATQGLVPSCCAGYSDEEVSVEGPWEEEDWSGSSDSSTGEDDNFTGFDSDWSSADHGRNDEDPRTYPKTSRGYSNKRFVTSGVGEDKGGPQDDEGSQSKSNESQDQGSNYETFESNMNLANVGDAIDVMKKLKKAKSDQEFSKKLRSGAKVVMHSIVHDLINNTGRAVKRKVGDMLSKKSVVDVSSSGWATLKDEGSTEPDHSSATVYNQSGPLVERLSIDFRKNISKEAKTSPSTKKQRAPLEKVKVSFFSGKVNDSKVIQQPSIQRKLKRVSGQGHNYSLARETLADNAKQNITDKNKNTVRAVDTRSLAVSNVKSVTLSTKRGEHIPDISSTLDSRDDKKKAVKNSIGDVAKIEETNESHTEHEVTQNAGENNNKRNQSGEKTNGDHISNYNVSNSVTQSQSEVMHVQKITNKQIHESGEQFIENDKNSRNNSESRNNESSSTLVNNVTQEIVSGRLNVAGNKTGKTRVLETLKIDFLRKNRTSHWNQNNTSNSKENALDTQRNVKLGNETNFKADSGKVVASSKSSPGAGSDKKRASIVNENNSNLHKPDVATSGANSLQTTKGDKEISDTKGTVHDTSSRVQTSISTKAEKIIVNLSRQEEKSKQNKTSITTTSENHKKVDKDKQQINLTGKTLQSTFFNTQMAKTDLDASSTPKKIESSVVHWNKQKMNTSSTYIIHKRAGSTISVLTANNVQEGRKHLNQLQNGPLGETPKNGVLDPSKPNKTIPKINIQVTKKDIIPSDIDSESSQNGKASSEVDKRSHIESERTRNAQDEISKQPVDKMMDKANTIKTYRVTENSRKSLRVSNHLPKEKRIDDMNISTTNTLERSNNSQGVTSYGKGFKNVKKDVEFLSLQKHPVSDHDDVKKDQSNAEFRTLQKKRKTEIKTRIKAVIPEVRNADTSLIQNSTSTTLAQSTEKDSENPQKSAHHPHEKSLKVSKKDYRISPAESIRSHQNLPENPRTEKETSKTDRENGTMHAEGATRSGTERRVTHASENAVSDVPGSGDVPGRGLTNDLGNDETHFPGGGVKHDPGKGATRDPNSAEEHEKGGRARSVPMTHFKNAKTQTNSKHVTQASRRTKEEERPSKGHHVTSQENSKNDDKKEPIKKQDSSSWTDTKPTSATEEDIKPSKPHQVDVLTSRTPPTSLLTTSNDDNTYSIKQIVQGPKGSSFASGSQDDDKVRKLEKKVFKLESEVTVLETALADLAKRLLVVEQKPEIPPPKETTIFPNPSNEHQPHTRHPVHSQQQTTVYVAKDLGTPPQNTVPQNGPDKIVIPISTLYPGGASSESIPSSSQNGEVDRQETKVDNQPDGQDQEKPQDSAHVTLHQRARPSPISEAHAVVRPIVNIIVPNNRADLLSEGAICIPRCQNGGRCFDRNICRCPTFFTGNHCERFSLRDLLESPAPQERPYRKLQRLVVSEPPDRQVLDGTLNLDPGSPPLEYRDLNQDLAPGKEYVTKQQPVEVASPSNSAEIDGGARRRQLILEI